jgi:cell division protein FtsQ
LTAGQAAGRAIGTLSSPARRAAILAGALALAVVGWLAWAWFRDSALVQVRHVQIEGVAGRDAAQIRQALGKAGRGMTTLHVRTDDLRRSVSPYASVRSLSVSTDFPSTLHVDVDQRAPVAALVAGKRKLAVAADGTVLAGEGTDKLPALPAGSVPADGRLAGRARVFARVLGGAPAGIRPLLDRIFQAPDGVRIALRDGPVIRFGSPDRLGAKWAAVTRLLAARATVGAKMIDVRLPERPAAQFSDPAEETTAPAVEQSTYPAAAATDPAAANTAGATGATTAVTPTTTEAVNPQP